MCSAGASGAEGGAVGLALGAGLLVLYADAGSAALAVDGVLLAVADVTAHAGDDVAAILLVHAYTSALYYLIIRHR